MVNLFSLTLEDDARKPKLLLGCRLIVESLDDLRLLLPKPTSARANHYNMQTYDLFDMSASWSSMSLISSMVKVLCVTEERLLTTS